MRHQAFDDDEDDDLRARVLGHGAAQATHATSTAAMRLPQRPSSPPWVPTGPRPGSQGGPGSARAKATVSAAGSRAGRSVEHTHMFLDDPKLPPTHAMNFFWVYASYDYKMQIPFDTAKQAVCKLIDRLMDRLIRAGTADGAEDPSGAAAPVSVMLHAPPIGLKADGSHRSQPPGGVPPPPSGSVDRPKVKGHLIFDIISTKKHITPEYTTGHPYQLGQDIYRYIDQRYSPWIITAFVGISDNTARRVGRDVYYSKADDNLSKTKVPFTAIDNEHMYIVFPPALGNAAQADEKDGAAEGGRRPKSRGPSPRRVNLSPQRKLNIPRPGR
jgi:hypothetical protein